MDQLFHRTQVNSMIPEIDQGKGLSRDRNFCFPVTFRVPNLAQHRAEFLGYTKQFPESKKVTSTPKYLVSSYMASLTKTYASDMAAKLRETLPHTQAYPWKKCLLLNSSLSESVLLLPLIKSRCICCLASFCFLAAAFNMSVLYSGLVPNISPKCVQKIGSPAPFGGF